MRASVDINGTKMTDHILGIPQLGVGNLDYFNSKFTIIFINESETMLKLSLLFSPNADTLHARVSINYDADKIFIDYWQWWIWVERWQ